MTASRAAAFESAISPSTSLAQIHYYQGRVREALKNAGAADSYKAFLTIKANGDEQGLVADARRRLESR